MKLKPTLYTLGVMGAFILSFIIKIGTQPLIYYILIGGITLFCVVFIFFEIYNIFHPDDSWNIDL